MLIQHPYGESASGNLLDDTVTNQWQPIPYDASFSYFYYNLCYDFLTFS